MKTAIIIGATGLTGHQLLLNLVSSEEYNLVYCISRKKPNIVSDKITHIHFDSGKYVIPIGINRAFCCLGTTIKKAGSKKIFREVDYGMVCSFAEKVKNAGTEHLAFVSSIGANKNSYNLYLRTKGEVEEQLISMNFTRLVLIRPSLLLGKRTEYRLAEELGKTLFIFFQFLFIGPLKKYKAVKAESVALSMIKNIDNDKGIKIIESNEI